jgi:hypothetical protein
VSVRVGQSLSRWAPAVDTVPVRFRIFDLHYGHTMHSTYPASLVTVSLLATFHAACSGMPQERDDWHSVFDGESLEGWVTSGGRYDGNASWSVEDGAIKGVEGPGHAGGLLYTAREYRNFEIELDANITYPFDSGIFCRMAPEGRGAQVTLDYRPGGEVGGIYSDGWYYHNPAGSPLYVRGAWNHFRVRCVGEPMHITVWMNGDLLTDYRIPEDSGGFAPTGKIGLQVHGSRDDPAGSNVRFKNLRVRELSSEAGTYFTAAEDGILALSEEGERAGWRSLFNGRDLTGWEAADQGTGFRVEAGVICFDAAGNSPELRTLDDYTDFHLRLDFKTERLANSGLFLRAARDGSNPAYSGCEIQILDDFNWEQETGTTLTDWQFTGSLYGAVAPAVKDALRPLGEWNTYEVNYRGSHLVTVLNGRTLYDVDTHALDVQPPFAERAAAGFIGLQRHAPAGEIEGPSYAWFRNLFIRPL